MPQVNNNKNSECVLTTQKKEKKIIKNAFKIESIQITDI